MQQVALWITPAVLREQQQEVQWTQQEMQLELQEVQLLRQATLQPMSPVK